MEIQTNPRQFKKTSPRLPGSKKIQNDLGKVGEDLDVDLPNTLSVLVAKGRAKVSVAASEADWSKRIREMQYADYEDHTVGS